MMDGCLPNPPPSPPCPPPPTASLSLCLYCALLHGRGPGARGIRIRGLQLTCSLLALPHTANESIKSDSIFKQCMPSVGKNTSPALPGEMQMVWETEAWEHLPGHEEATWHKILMDYSPREPGISGWGTPSGHFVIPGQPQPSPITCIPLPTSAALSRSPVLASFTKTLPTFSSLHYQGLLGLPVMKNPYPICNLSNLCSLRGSNLGASWVKLKLALIHRRQGEIQGKGRLLQTDGWQANK